MRKAISVLWMIIVVLAFIPVSAHCQLFDQDNDIFSRSSCRFVVKPSVCDSITVIDPVEHDEIRLYCYSSPTPVTVCGRKIYRAGEVSTPARYYEGEESVESYLMKNLAPYFRSLAISDDTFRIHFHDMIIDEDGRVAYFRYAGVTRYNGGQRIQYADGTLAKRINRLMSNAPAMIPATRKGRNVAAFTDSDLSDYLVEVTRGEVRYIKIILVKGRRSQ